MRCSRSLAIDTFFFYRDAPLGKKKGSMENAIKKMNADTEVAAASVPYNY